MGNTSSKTQIKFGSIKDIDNPRPGYHVGTYRVTYGAKVLPIKNISTFVKLGYGYAKTDTQIFFKGTPLKNKPDIKTFQVHTRENVKTIVDPNKPIGTNSVLASDVGSDGKRRYYIHGVLIS